MLSLKPTPVTRKEVNHGFKPEQVKTYVPSQKEIDSAKKASEDFKLERKVYEKIRIAGKFLVYGFEKKHIDKKLAMDHVVATMFTEAKPEIVEERVCTLLYFWYKETAIRTIANSI